MHLVLKLCYLLIININIAKFILRRFMTVKRVAPGTDGLLILRSLQTKLVSHL
jgi:hypothetical protein